MSSAPRVVCAPQSLRLTPEREQRFVEDALRLFEKTRLDMGYTSEHGSYTYNSWLHKRAIAMRRYDDDFSDRLCLPVGAPCEKLFKTSNRTLNLISVVIDQHLGKLTKDFTPDGSFIALKPPGTEDAHFILKTAEQYVQNQAAKKSLGQKLKDEVTRGALIRGETIAKVIPNTTQRTIPQKLKILLHPREDGQGLEPVRDSTGGFVHEKDVWIPASEDPTREVLQRDPAVWRLTGRPITYSDQPREVLITVSEPAGASVEIPFWADFGATLDAPTLDAADLRFHVFEMAVDDLWETIPAHLRTKAAEDYYRMASRPGNTSSLRSEQSAPLFKTGEDQTNSATDSQPLSNGLTKRFYAELWIRYDITGTRHRSDLRLLVDVDARIPIAYDYAHEVLGALERRHPFVPTRILPQTKRWYGRGYYSKYHDLAEEIDADFNRITLENAKSGNLIFEKRDATEEGRAGIPLAFRTPNTFKLTDQHNADDAVKVITVSPQVAEIQSRLEFNLTAFLGRVGGVSPGDTEGQQLAANTATGLQILQEVKNEHVEARHEELRGSPVTGEGITGILTLFGELELLRISPAAVTRQFGQSKIKTGRQVTLMEPALAPDGTPLIDEKGQPVLQPATQEVLSPLPMDSGAAPVSPRPQNGGERQGEGVAEVPTVPVLEPVMVDETVPAAETLLAWAATLKPEEIRDMVRLVVTRSRSTQIVQTNDNILKLLDKWLAYTPTPAIADAVKPIFVEMLLALDVSDPETLLTSLQSAASDPATQAALMAAAATGQNAAPNQESSTTPGAPTSAKSQEKTAQRITEPQPITGQPNPDGPGKQSPPPRPTL